MFYCFIFSSQSSQSSQNSQNDKLIMSSNIRVNRICKCCNTEFIASTTVTLYCSKKCNSKAYKDRKREEKIKTSTKRVYQKKTSNVNVNELQVLTVSQAAIFLGCSRRNIYKLIDSDKLKTTNVLENKTKISRISIDKYIESVRIKKMFQKIDISECYTLTQVQKKYGISEKALYEIIKRNTIPKIKKGIFTYCPKVLIDKIFK